MSTIHPDFLSMIEPYIPERKMEGFAEACRRPLKKTITINTARISVDDFLTMVKPRGWTLTPHDLCESNTTRYIDREDTSLALGNTFLYKCGFFYIQELAASMPAPLVDIQPGERVLDIAAAPGGKTSQLSTRMLGMARAGLVVANDIASSRIKTLAHNLNLQGCYNTAVTKFNGFSFGKNLPEFFDHVLVDAPCSGEGTAFKSDMALKHWRIEEINKIGGTQFQILRSAVKTTKIGGTVIYSTCTLNPYENELILARIVEFFEGSVVLESVDEVKTDPGVSYSDDEFSFTDTDKVRRLRPHRQKTGGFFVSKLRKVSGTRSPEREPKHYEHKLLPKNQFKLDHSKKLQQSASKYLQETFGVTVDPEKELFIATKDKVYLVSPEFLDIQKHLHCEKAGIPVLKIDRNIYRPTHYCGLIFGDRATRNVLDFDDNQMQDYVLGKLLPADEKPTSSYQMIKRNGFGMSTTKWVMGEWKNKYGK